ncbi:MAG: heme biosynthesis HemY N-terminal domain-containing protein [Hyphomicrobiales bacterium]|nr:heme biosynthesis HemY N-terminal domain-containing protein [Hyphomicrobiales bacterium]
MIRILLFLALLTAAAIGLAWFADNPGTVTVNWLGNEAETSVFQAVILLLLALTALWLVATLILTIISGPGRLALRLQMRRRRKGFKALQDGIFAAGAGDSALASKCAAIANKFVPNKPLTRLLRAQAAQLSGDRAGAQRIFAGMLDDPDTKLLGLRGLFLEAKQDGQLEAARLYVDQALRLNQALPWPATALFEFQCQSADWTGALATLGIAKANRVMDRKTCDRRRAVILTALAMESEERGDGKATDLALEAHKLAVDLVPAAAIAGRALAASGSTSRAARILAETWRQTPHPDLATAYAYARPGDSPRDRLTRVQALAGQTPGHPESAIAIATAAVEARAWDDAREALHFLLLDNPPMRVCMLMARIENGENRDAGRVREWLAKALRAPRDPAWIADGVVSDEWAALSPVTLTVDAFIWDTPPERMKSSAPEDRIFAELERLEPALEEQAMDSPEVDLSIAAQQPARQDDKKTTNNDRSPSLDDLAVLERTPEPRRQTGSEVIVIPRSRLEPAPQIANTEIAEPRAVVKTQAVAVRNAETVTSPVAVEAAPVSGTLKPRKTARPNIFVADRPPDDPGSADMNDEDDAPTPLTRYRTTAKDQA